MPMPSPCVVKPFGDYVPFKVMERVWATVYPDKPLPVTMGGGV
jgi:hypothetical protein